MIAIVNMRCKQAYFLPGMPANVPHFVSLWVCGIDITFKMLSAQLKPQMFIGIGPTHWPNNFVWLFGWLVIELG